MPDLQPIVRALDEVIRETIPGLRYAVKWRKAYDGLPEQGGIIELAAYDVSVNLVFFGGADLDPRPPLGTVGRSRYVKLKSLHETRDPVVRNWIRQAGRLHGWKWTPDQPRAGTGALTACAKVKGEVRAAVPPSVRRW
jgi:hypothetical protein